MDLDAVLDERLAQLDLAQKVRLLTGRSSWRLYGDPAIGLAEIVVSDGPIGVRGERYDERDWSLALPSPTCLAASWDPDLVQRLGVLLATEARRKDVDVLLAPTINLHRSPLGGRHFEAYSEDPLLTARIGAAYVRGVQSGGVGATAKHYVANDAETDRFTVDNIIDERTLRELYLAPFEPLVRDEGVWLVMSAYNSVNGHTMSENPLLADPLEREWAFDGVVISDWTAVRSTVASARAAQDLAMPGPDGPWGDALVEAVRDGRVPEAAIDAKVRRLLRLAARVGRLDGVEPAVTEPAVTEAQDARPLLRAAAAAGSVLLRNEPVDGSPVLPLNAGALRRLAVLGPNSADARIQGGGSAHVHPREVVSPLAGLRRGVAPGVEVLHTVGAPAHDRPEPLDVDDATNPESGEPGVLARLLAADGTELRREHRLSGLLIWPDDEQARQAAVVEVHARVPITEPGRWAFAVGGIGRYSLEVDGATVLDEHLEARSDDVAAALFQPLYATHEADLAAGVVVELVARAHLDPPLPRSGRPPQIWVAARPPRLTAEQEMARAVELATEAETAVVVVGTTAEIESEGFDRTTLALPGRQDELVHRVAAVNPRTVVVVNAGSPVEMPWRDEVAAILLVWFPGQECGAALADVLFGRIEPGGRLPTTWPDAAGDVPVLTTTPTGGRLEYREGLDIGYRAWALSPTAPAYPFGFGLGYTTWAIDDLVVDARVAAGDDVTASVTVANTGARAGRHVVQLYLTRADSDLDRPALWLAGFGAASVEPANTAEVTVTVPARAFAHWDVDAHAWVTEPGTFTLRAGSSVDDLPVAASVVVG